jgi:hypothetical protein
MTSLRIVSAPRHLAAAAALLGLLVTGCGDAGKGKLNARQADKLNQQVTLAQAAVDKGNCGAAHNAAAQGAHIATSFGKGVSRKLQNNLVEGFNHLNSVISDGCSKPQKDKTPTPTPSPVETVTEVPTSPPTPSPTPSPTATPTPTEAATVEATPTSNGLGGAQPTP